VLFADTTASDVDAPKGSEADSSYGITGNWWGARDALAKSHVYVGGYLIFDAAKALSGSDTRRWPLLYLLDLHLTIDADALGLKGGMFYLDFQSHHQTDSADAAVQDTQRYDNIAAPNFVQIAQLWYKQVLGDWRIKVGKIDANIDAAVLDGPAIDAFSLMEHGTDFLHSAAAFPPAIVAMNTYPIPLPGAEIFYGKDQGFYAGAGAFYSTNDHQNFLVFSGHPESVEFTNGGAFIIAETGYRWSLNGLAGHGGLGGWVLSGDVPFTLVNDKVGNFSDTSGGYAFIDQSLFHEESKNAPTRDIGFFLNGGITNKWHTSVPGSIAGGIAAAGFVPGRPDDTFGLMGTWAKLTADSSDVKAGEILTEGVSGFESSVEVFYKLHVANGFDLKPDFQYILSPAALHPDAAIITLRAEVTF
jgi:carbohydrate-selective porin OprB